MPYRILLTGATGFVGTAVLRALRPLQDERDVLVRALTRDPASRGPESPAMEWVSADLADPDSLHGLAEGVDAVVHLASRIDGSVKTHGRTPRKRVLQIVGSASRSH